ncbi:MAG: hypothetical protein SFZ03_03285 [Candidatus Melainabacteria bacterium]|nr:hypothetical protein [Candidatus Melainabacteria bacterium]
MIASSNRFGMVEPAQRLWTLAGCAAVLTAMLLNSPTVQSWVDERVARKKLRALPSEERPKPESVQPLIFQLPALREPNSTGLDASGLNSSAQGETEPID